MKWIKTESIDLGGITRTYTRGDYTIRGRHTDHGWRYVAHHAGVRIEGQPLPLTQSFQQAKAVCNQHAQEQAGNAAGKTENNRTKEQR